MNTENRKKQQTDYKLRKRSELRLRVVEYFSEHPCISCGENDPLVLEFDHRDRDSKILSVSRLVNNCSSWKAVLEEINKCDVLCANCHRRKTHKQLNFWKQIDKDMMACRLNGRTEGFEPSYLGSSPSEPAKRVGYSNLFPSEVSSDVRPDIKIASEGKPWNSAGVDMTPACCLNKKPCKHWSWDGVNSQYVNSITGEIKPVEV